MPLFLLSIRDAEVSQNEYGNEYMLTIYIFLGRGVGPLLQ